MLLRVPDYYKHFQCIAAKCKNSCCIGWEIDIDEDTFDYYQNIPGKFGEKLRHNMTNEKENHFHLKGNHCPFLNQNNLCDICMELGEESLCEICTEYPRFTTEYANTVEKCLGLSCEEACRIIIENKNKVVLEDMYFEEEEEKIPQREKQAIVCVETVRKTSLKILQNRKDGIQKRLQKYLSFCYEVQTVRNHSERFLTEVEIEDIFRKVDGLEPDSFSVKIDFFQNFLNRLRTYEELEILNETWPAYLKKMKQLADMYNKEEVLQNIVPKISGMKQELEIEFEQLAVYFVIRYAMKGVSDGQIASYAGFLILSLLFIRDMFLTKIQLKDDILTKEERIDMIRLYSSEVEHSKENMEFLYKSILFEPCFSKENLLENIICFLEI